MDMKAPSDESTISSMKLGGAASEPKSYKPLVVSIWLHIGSLPPSFPFFYSSFHFSFLPHFHCSSLPLTSTISDIFCNVFKVRQEEERAKLRLSKQEALQRRMENELNDVS